MPLRIVDRSSPNHDTRPQGAAVDMLVVHYTGMKTAEEALTRLCDPQAKVSSHYTIDRDGQVYRHVDEERRAWHAGVSWWAGERNVNARSIGIELVNPGHEFGYIPFAEEQIGALIDLCHGILSRHPIPPERVVAHSDVAPARKEDPGELFPWKHLAEFGIGKWPAKTNPPLEGGGRSAGADPGDRSPTSKSAKQISGRGHAEFLDNLRRYGYGVPPDVDVPPEKIIAAFQRHFRPSCIDGVADDHACAILDALLGR
ncbi:MAG: N-acetylmuramoyl-L-alanine amidase [Proteobacteria bacterium]|nr:N-acetylmuramoyl-L-alanine amidase [Pseudomonadota bacterium]